jgi:uncharacterized membrane protein YeaQ/YmgE (transglycosylase-associated protein family)
MHPSASIGVFLPSEPFKGEFEMEGLGWIMSIVIGALAGWIAEKLTKSQHGLLLNIVLGIVGAIIGNFLLMMVFGATMGGIFGQLVVAVIGAVLLISLVRLIRGRRAA